MPAAPDHPHAELLRRLDDLPIREHERRAAMQQAALAFGIVDAIGDAVDYFRVLFAPARRHAPR